MNQIHQCFQNISPGNHFSYVRDRTYVRTDKGDAICPPPPIINGGGIKKIVRVFLCQMQLDTPPPPLIKIPESVHPVVHVGTELGGFCYTEASWNIACSML